MGAKEDAIQTLENSAKDFAEAVWGRDVRQGLVDVVNALKAVVEGYATVVTDDLTDDDPNAAAQAAAVKTALENVREEIGTGLLATITNYGVLPNGSNVDDLLGTGALGLMRNSFVVLRGDYTYENAPFSDGGYLLSVGLSIAGSRGGLQVGFGKRGNVFSRILTAGVFSDWFGGIDNTVTKQHSAADAKAVRDLFNRTRLTGMTYTYGISADDLIENGVYFNSKTNDYPHGTITDLPYDDVEGWLEVTKTVGSQLALQIFYPYTSSNLMPKRRMRRKDGTWTDWMDFADTSNFYKPLTGINLENYPNGFSLINDMPVNTVAVCEGGAVLSANADNQLTGLPYGTFYYVEKTGRGSFAKIELQELWSGVKFHGTLKNGTLTWLEENNVDFELELGAYRGAYGYYYNDPVNRARIKVPVHAGEYLRINTESDVKCTVRMLDENLQLIYSTSWFEPGETILFPKVTVDQQTHDVGYYLITFAYVDDSDITDLSDLAGKISIMRKGISEEKSISVDFRTKGLPLSLTENATDSPALVFVKYKREENKQPVPIGYLYRDVHEPFNFYYDSGDGLKKIFTWDKSVTYDGNRDPIYYSCAVTNEGDVLFVYRGELAKMVISATLRRNPIIYRHDDYEHPVEIDFGSNVKPTSWLQNGGVYCEEGQLFIAEYTRPGTQADFAKCNVWKVTAPYYSTENWTIVRQFDVGTDNFHFKHCHTIDKDPFTGVLYLSTGDHNDGAKMLCSDDDGSTWTMLIDGSQKYCRQLNFIWTKDYVYWATDTTDTNLHFLFRTKRNSSGVIDVQNIEEIYHWYTTAATYSVCYSKRMNGILCLDRHDDRTTVPLNLYFYDIAAERMRFAGRLDPLGSVFGGFRCEAVSTYESPYDDGFRCGFSMYPNQNDIIGNERNAGDSDNNGFVSTDSGNVGHINNLIMSVRRT